MYECMYEYYSLSSKDGITIATFYFSHVLIVTLIFRAIIIIIIIIII
jgi:hypothetical protein